MYQHERLPAEPEDLDRLVQLAVSDRSPEAYVSLSAERGVTKFKADNLAALWAEMDEPARVDEMQIWMSDPEPHDPGWSTTVLITQRTEIIRVSVSGSNETWVRGRTEELREFLGPGGFGWPSTRTASRVCPRWSWCSTD